MKLNKLVKRLLPLLVVAIVMIVSNAHLFASELTAEQYFVTYGAAGQWSMLIDVMTLLQAYGMLYVLMLLWG